MRASEDTSDSAGRKSVVQKPQKRKKRKHAAATAAASHNDADSSEAKACGADAGRKTLLQQDDTIDSIFAGRAAKVQPPASPPGLAADATQKQTEKSGKAHTKASKQLTATVKGSKDDLFDEGPSRTRRRDGEGLPIYTTEELKVGSGGDTAACPFDCECCF